MQEMTNKPAPRRLRNHCYAICYMSISGMKPDAIAKEVGLSPDYIRKLLTKPEMVALGEKIHWQIFGKDIKKRIEHILPKAIDVNEKLMMDELVKPSIRKDIASDFMDRSLGKPVQPLNVHTSSIKELLVTIKERSAKKPVDSQSTQAKNESIDAEYSEVKDISESSEDIGEVEKWVQENFGGGSSGKSDT